MSLCFDYNDLKTEFKDYEEKSNFARQSQRVPVCCEGILPVI